MKKILMTLAVALLAVSASAQVYVGGSVGIASIDNGGDDDETVYSLLPEVGYNFNKDWAVGVEFGWSKGNLHSDESGLQEYGTQHTFEINPYVRYTFFHSKLVDVFCDGTIGYKHYQNTCDEYTIGLKPGIALNLSNSVSLVAHAGFAGYQTWNPKGDGENTSKLGIDVDGNNISLGVLFKF